MVVREFDVQVMLDGWVPMCSLLAARKLAWR